MRYMTYILFTIAAFVAITTAFTRPAAAQEDVGRLLQQLENSSDRFSKSLDNAMDNSALNGTSQEGEMTRYVKDFEDSVDRLKRQYDDQKYAKIAAQEVLTRAKTINSFMKRNRLDATAQTDWSSVKADINRIAQAYRVKGIR